MIASLIFVRLSKHNYSFKLEIIHFCRHPASFKILFSKVQDFGNFDFSPMYLSNKVILILQPDTPPYK